MSCGQQLSGLWKAFCTVGGFSGWAWLVLCDYFKIYFITLMCMLCIYGYLFLLKISYYKTNLSHRICYVGCILGKPILCHTSCTTDTTWIWKWILHPWETPYRFFLNIFFILFLHSIQHNLLLCVVVIVVISECVFFITSSIKICNALLLSQKGDK